jgi:hypothetical protein
MALAFFVHYVFFVAASFCLSIFAVNGFLLSAFLAVGREAG